jgi:DNA polymerase-3 subunit alpha
MSAPSSSTYPFIHIRTHSAYSLAEGALKIKDYPSLCESFSMPAVGICDTHNMFGALEFAQACEKSGIQPIIGCHVRHFGPDNDSDIYTLPLFCKNEEGYRHLLKILSFSYLHMHTRGGEAVVLWEELLDHSPGLLALTGGADGYLATHLLKNKIDHARTFLDHLEGAYKDHVYIELQRHPTSFVQDKEDALIQLAYDKSIPLIATNDVFFSHSDMYEAHDALLCIAKGTYVDETNRRRVTPHHFFKSSQAMAALFKDIPEALDNTYHFARRCGFAPHPHDPILPPFAGEKGEADILEEKAYQGLEKRLCDNAITDSSFYKQRLKTELDIINAMGFPGYFLIVADFIQWAKSQNIPVGPGRGSGAGSLVAYALTITDMDPIRFGLIFERFLNPERVSMPDFDVDFCQDRRDEVIQYVCEKYGLDKVAHIITFGKLQARAVVRDVGRVLQMPYTYVDKISKLIPNNPANPVTLKQSLELEPALKKAMQDDEAVERLINLGMKLEGLYRHASMHAAGVVIGDRPLYELVPLYRDEKAHLAVTQFSMKYAEMAGLVKFDFLGLKTLSVIDKACFMAKKRGKDVDIHHIPLDDANTLKLMCDVNVMGVFQLESGGMQDVLRKMQPDRFEDIIALVALYRPGPMDDIPRYLNCKHGREDVTYLHPLLEPILEPTYGVMVYQEQVMHIAQKLGGYSLGEADLLRRAMGKKIKEEMDKQRVRFIDGCVKKNIDAHIASKIFDAMAKFAGYGFNKSHSAPYALLSYQTAYLKANHPLEFYAASLSYDVSNMEKLNLFRQDMVRLGYHVFPPDINASHAMFVVEDKENGPSGLRWALAALKNVGEGAMESLVQERQRGGVFQSLEDFCRRVPPNILNKRQLETLIAAGAFDSIDKDRATLYENTETIIKASQNYHKDKTQNQTNLFDFMGGGEKAEEERSALKLTSVNSWGFHERLQKEFDALNFYLSDHPLKPYAARIEKEGFFSSSNIHTCEDNQRIRLAALVVAKQERTSKQGHKFAFLQCFDLHGNFEVVVFPKVYGDYRDIIQGQAKFALDVVVRRDEEAVRLSVQSLTPLDQPTGPSDTVIHINETIDIKELSFFLNQCEEGDVRLFIILQFNDPLPSLKLMLKKRVALSADKSMDLLTIKGVEKIT